MIARMLVQIVDEEIAGGHIQSENSKKSKVKKMHTYTPTWRGTLRRSGRDEQLVKNLRDLL